jgi:hypothetical protein
MKIFQIILLSLVATFAMATPMNFPNPNVAEGIRVIPQQYIGFGADLKYIPNTTWSISWEDLSRKSQNLTDDDFNDWQGFVKFGPTGGQVWRSYDGAGYILTMYVGHPTLVTVHDADSTLSFLTNTLTKGQIIPLTLSTSVGTTYYSGNTNNGIGDSNSNNLDGRVHAIISCISGNCSDTSSTPQSPVPEPETFELVGLSLIGVYFHYKKIV